jgi:hypothetical protein
MKLNDLRVIQRDEKTGKLTWSITKTPKSITGIDKLVQTFALNLLNDPGRDSLDPYKGGGLLSMIGQYNYDDSSTSAVMDEIYRRLEKTATEVRLDQANLLNEDESALLSAYKILDFGGDPQGGIYLKIRLISKSGVTKDLTI